MLGCAAITPVMPRMLLGPTMRVKEEKPNELRLDATRRRRSSWCEDGEIIEGALAIVLWTGATGSVTLVQERQFQHEVGQATAAVEVVDHLNVNPTLASTVDDLDLRPDRMAQKGEVGGENGSEGTESRAEEGLP